MRFLSVLFAVAFVAGSARAESPPRDVGPWDARGPELMDTPSDPLDAAIMPRDAGIRPDTGATTFDASLEPDAGDGRSHAMACTASPGSDDPSITLLALGLAAIVWRGGTRRRLTRD